MYCLGIQIILECQDIFFESEDVKMRKDIGGTRRLISGDKIYVLDIENLTISEIELKKEHFCKEFADNTHIYDSSKHCFMTVDREEYF